MTRPLRISIHGFSSQSPQAVCAAFLDFSRWPQFSGYGPLPGIRSAAFEARTPELAGSRIRVHNTDGSSHVEEIVEWMDGQRITLRFDEFQPPLSRIASHFIERWELAPSGGGTRITRSLEFYPTGFAGRMLLIPIAWMMRRALLKSVAPEADAPPEPPHRS
jgi:hypothetical protein